MPKRYLVFKWVIYVIATFLLLQVQTWVLDHVEVWGDGLPGSHDGRGGGLL